MSATIRSHVGRKDPIGKITRNQRMLDAIDANSQHRHTETYYEIRSLVEANRKKAEQEMKQS